MYYSCFTKSVRATETLDMAGWASKSVDIRRSRVHCPKYSHVAQISTD